MQLVIGLVILLLATTGGTTTVDYLENLVKITSCRASCLDQFSHIALIIRTEDSCRKENNCLMCWETCQMLIEKRSIWGSLCFVPDICLPGCQTACRFINSKSYKNTVAVIPNRVMSVHEPVTDRVRLEWIPDHQLKSQNAVLYSVFLKEESERWHQVAQTTSHVVHIQRGLLGRNTTIRVVAANATGKVSDTETSYFNSYVSGAVFSDAEKNSSKLWKPKLESMVRSQTRVGLVASITWPAKDHIGPVQYDVSWNVIDKSIEITGHLRTENNEADITLWPDSLYSVQVNCITFNEDILSQSDPLILDTRSSHLSFILQDQKSIESPSVECAAAENLAVNAFTFFIILSLLVVIACLLKHRKKIIMENSKVRGEIQDILHLDLIKIPGSKNKMSIDHHAPGDRKLEIDPVT